MISWETHHNLDTTYYSKTLNLWTHWFNKSTQSKNSSNSKSSSFRMSSLTWTSRRTFHSSRCQGNSRIGHQDRRMAETKCKTRWWRNNRRISKPYESRRSTNNFNKTRNKRSKVLAENHTPTLDLSSETMLISMMTTRIIQTVSIKTAPRSWSRKRGIATISARYYRKWKQVAPLKKLLLSRRILKMQLNSTRINWNSS